LRVSHSGSSRGHQQHRKACLSQRITANETGDERQAVFNLINGILLQRKLGIQVQPQSVAYIRDWARIRDDSRLEEVLDLALRIKIEEYANACEKDAD